MYEEGRAVLVDGHAGFPLGDAVHDAIRLFRMRGGFGSAVRLTGACMIRLAANLSAVRPYLGAFVTASSVEPRRFAAPRRVHDDVRETGRGRGGGYRADGYAHICGCVR